MMTMISVVFLLLSCLSVFILAEEDFIPRCGECWCIAEMCPTYGPGIQDALDDDIIAAYASYVETSEPITLGGGDCYPFADSVGAVDDKYPESNQPQCILAPPQDGSVCAIVVDKDDTTDCTYTLATFASEQDALEAGANITHGGACGVCSNLADFAARMKYDDMFETTSLLCSVSYSVGRDFAALVECYQTRLELSLECSTLWAHYSATNVAVCADVCAEGAVAGGTIELNGPPPTCTLSECLQCSNSTFQVDFDVLSGRTLENSGITERLARPCDVFYPVNHIATCIPNNETMTTMPPTTSGSGEIITSFSKMALLAFWAIIGGYIM